MAMSGLIIDFVLDMQCKSIRAAGEHNDLFPLAEPVLVPVRDAPVQLRIINLDMTIFKCDDMFPVRRHITSPIGIVSARGNRFLLKCYRIQ